MNDTQNGAGWAKVPWRIIDAAGQIGPHGIAVYCAIARFADSDGVAWPSMSRIAATAGVGIRTARGSVRALVNLGHVLREYRQTTSGDPDTPLYRLPVGAAGYAVPTAPNAGGVRQDMPGGTAPRADKQEPYNKNHRNKRAHDSVSDRQTIPPPIDLVRSFVTEHNYRVDPDAWYDHYSACGWMVGRTRMRDWQAAVRQWHRRSGQYPTRDVPPATTQSRRKVAPVGRPGEVPRR